MNQTLETIEKAIAEADPEDQRRLLANIPQLLKIDTGDLSLLKSAESAFGFWDNKEDAVYDEL